MPTLSILAGPRGLRPGDELTFFYPSTEWRMAQAFDCFCGTPSCRGRISGAESMDPKALEGVWLNGFMREMLGERDAGVLIEDGIEAGSETVNGKERADDGMKCEGQELLLEALKVDAVADEIEEVFVEMLERARLSAKLAEQGLASYHRKKVLLQQQQAEKQQGEHGHEKTNINRKGNDSVHENITVDGENIGRVGPTSRELSGEMGGDTFST
jgi:hypothetical protein